MANQTRNPCHHYYATSARHRRDHCSEIVRLRFGSTPVLGYSDAVHILIDNEAGEALNVQMSRKYGSNQPMHQSRNLLGGHDEEEMKPERFEQL